YLKRQREVLGRQVHLVEIDLLRSGAHSTAVPLDLAVAKAGPFDYHVCIHHFDNLEDFFVYPLWLGTRLPSIAVPLLPGDPPASAHLQALLDRAYAPATYARETR